MYNYLISIKRQRVKMKRSLHLFMLRGGVFVCIVMLLLTSCENFLKANQVKSEIEEAIEIANSSPILYHIIADKDSETVSPSQATLKKKQSVNLLFTPAEGWNFICWEALDRTTGELLPDAIKSTSSPGSVFKSKVVDNEKKLLELNYKIQNSNRELDEKNNEISRLQSENYWM